MLMAEVFFAVKEGIGKGFMEFLAELHPKIVHFPIALLFTYTFLEIVAFLSKKEFFFKAAFLILGLGVFSSVLALLTGEQASLAAKLLTETHFAGENPLPQLTAIEQHEDSATFVIWLFTGLLVYRTWHYIKTKKRKQILMREKLIRISFIFIALLGSYFIYLAGEQGGQLVYKHGIGTELFEKSLEQPDTLERK